MITNTYKFWSENFKERNLLGDVGVYRITILNLILQI